MLVHFVKTDEIRAKIETLFESEKEKLSQLFPDADIQHIGSTAVPGTLSKGDLDINIRVSGNAFGATIEKLKNVYAINQPDNWTKNFASFKDETREIGIQVTVFGSSSDCFVAQREYFKSHPDAVLLYNTLKRNFEGKDMDEYRKAKNDFLKNFFSPKLFE